MRKVISVLIVISVISVMSTSPVEAVTEEANFRSNFEITFFQTFPFAVLWGYFIDQQLSNLMFPGTSPHWTAILTFAGGVSVANAFYSNYQNRNSRR